MSQTHLGRRKPRVHDEYGWGLTGSCLDVGPSWIGITAKGEFQKNRGTRDYHQGEEILAESLEHI